MRGTPPGVPLFAAETGVQNGENDRDEIEMKRNTWLLTLALAATLAFTGCGGGSPDGGDGSSSSSSSSSSGSSGGSSNASSAMPADLKKALESQEKRSFTAMYSFAMVGSAKTDLKWAQKGENSVFVSMGTAEEIQLISIRQGESSYSCTRLVSGNGTCEKVKSTAGSTLSFDDVAEDLRGVSAYKKAADKNVNGRDSQCWELFGTDKWNVCVAKKDGEITLLEFREYTIELKEFSGSADDKLFTPPYPVE